MITIEPKLLILKNRIVRPILRLLKIRIVGPKLPLQKIGTKTATIEEDNWGTKNTSTGDKNQNFHYWRLELWDQKYYFWRLECWDQNYHYWRLELWEQNCDYWRLELLEQNCDYWRLELLEQNCDYWRLELLELFPPRPRRRSWPVGTAHSNAAPVHARLILKKKVAISWDNHLNKSFKSVKKAKLALRQLFSLFFSIIGLPMGVALLLPSLLHFWRQVLTIIIIIPLLCNDNPFSFFICT